MEGFIPAAGLGTRLLPLTSDRPKALLTVGGKTLLEHTILRLCSFGVNHIVVNIHHFADLMQHFIESRSWPCPVDISDERSLLLDTGGGLKKASSLFRPDTDVVVHNVDIFSDVDLRLLASHHRHQHNLATLCLSRRTTSRLLAFREGRLVGRCTPSSLPEGCEALAFSGISILSPSLFPLLPPADSPYPIIDQLISLASTHPIGSFIHSPDHWLDVGKPDTLEKARQWNLSSPV